VLESWLFLSFHVGCWKRKTPGQVARELVRDVGDMRPTPLRKKEGGTFDGGAVHRIASVSARV